MTTVPESDRAVRAWLLSLFGMISLMVVIGGITRLTGSGLSMVEWHPLMGTIPPLSESDWQEVFAQYQQSPQYLQVNDWMELADFKKIFFWEYIHRLCGRLMGVVFLLPFLLFLKQGRLRGRLAFQTGVAFVLGGLQGLLGWFMVKSGLVDQPSVSHLRLAAHLSLAFITALYVLWIWLGLRWPQGGKPDRAVTRALCALGALIGLQVVYGAFMAGMRAGHISYTFPLMNGAILPLSMLEGQSLSEVFLWNPVGIHIVHRGLGWIVVFVAPVVAWWARRRANTPLQRGLCTALVVSVLAQFCLGALTVLLGVAIPVAVLHQLGALVLLAFVTACVYSFRPKVGVVE